MKHRVAFRMKLFPGKEDEYRKRHNELWPELATLLKGAGVSNYSIFLDTETLYLFGSLQVEDPAMLDELREQPVMKRWWTFMKDLMDTHPDHSPVSLPLQEVFYLP